MTIGNLRLLLFGAALGWGLFPYWGGLGFAAVYGLLLLTVKSKQRAAAKKLSAHEAELSKSVSAEAIGFAKQHPLFYVWPAAAKEWALTMKVVSLMVLLLSAWFIARGLLFWQPWVILCLVPATAIFFLGVTWGDRLDLENVLPEPKWAGRKVLHDEVRRVLVLQSLAGKWSPGDPA